MSKTSAVIVNWNGAAYLDSLIQSIGSDVSQIIVVDNKSTDGSLTNLNKYDNIQVIANSENLGFAIAANQGIAIAKTTNVLILNSDVLALPGSIPALEKFLDEHDDSAAVAPRLLFPDGSLQVSCRNFPTPFSLFLYLSFLDRIFPTQYRLSSKEHQNTRIVQQPMGAALMVRKNVLDQIGGFDESFFLYMEDVDLCERIMRAGWNIYYFPQAQFVHDAGGSSRQDWYGSQSHFVSSVLLYFQKRGSNRIAVKIMLALAFLIRTLICFFSGQLHRVTDNLRLTWRSLEA